MIRDKYKIYGEKNDPNTVTATNELPDNALVLGAGDKTIKAVTTFPRANNGLLIEKPSELISSLYNGDSFTDNLVNGEPSTVSLIIGGDVYEVDFPGIPVVGDTTTMNIVSSVIYKYFVSLQSGNLDYYKLTFTIGVYRRVMAGVEVPTCNISVNIKDSQGTDLPSGHAVNDFKYIFNYYCPINFTNTDPSYNIRTINIEYSSADPYGIGEVYQDNVLLGDTDNATVDIDITKDTRLLNTFTKTNYNCGITVYNGSTIVSQTSGRGSSTGLSLTILANTEFTRIVFWDDN